MKKLYFYVLATVGICFFIPIFFTTKFKVKEVFIEQEPVILDVDKYSYSDFGTIKLLHSKTGEVEEKPLDEYITEVVSAEIPADYELEAIKAQAVAARSYTIYKIIHGSKHENADICDDFACCQAWLSKNDRIAKWGEDGIDKWNKIIEAVNGTLGEVGTYEGQIINAFFHSNSGGTTETVSEVWGGADLPYLQVVETSGEEAYTQYSSEVILSREELLNKLKEKYKDIEIDFANKESIKVLEYTESGRVKTIRFGNRELSRSRNKNTFWIKVSKFCCEFSR